MIIITGAAGFIGSCLLSKLNNEGYYDVVLVDDFSKSYKNNNFKGKKFSYQVHRNDFIDWLKTHHRNTELVFHFGARTDTAETNQAVFDELNLNYSKKVWNTCVEFGLPLVYASSAATYGNGANGYSDSIAPNQLLPLNLYGHSKNNFDAWALKQPRKPYFWIGLKFFNVYGPNEYHKKRMASVVFHAFNQITTSNKVNLFRSHRQDVKDGQQMRDFIYVKDVTNVCLFLMQNRKNSGIYNLGSGRACSFNDLAIAVFKTLHKTPNIQYIDTPLTIRNSYQYFTQAPMDKLKAIGYNKPFTPLEQGIDDYVQNYLLKQKDSIK